jgi:NADH-quinone oxidoreductase subunit E
MTKNKELIENLVKEHGKKRESLMPILQALTSTRNYLSKGDMAEIAIQLNISAADVYGTATFYSFLDREKRGKYVIRVCKSIIAEMKGKKDITKTLENILKIKVGGTTSDEMFTLLETNDIGWSDQEPSMLINEIPYTNLTPDKVVHIINEYRSK